MSQRSTAQHYHTDTPFCTIRKSHVTWNFAVPGPHSEEIRRCILLFLCTLGTYQNGTYRTLAWVLVINERAWFFSVHIDSGQQGEREIDVLRMDLFRLWTFANSKCKTRKYRRRGLFSSFFFTFFDGVWNLFQAPSNGQTSLSLSLSRIYLSRIVEKVPKNLSSYAPDQDEGNKQQCN